MTIEQGWSRPVRNSRSVHQVRWTFERRRMTQPRLQWRRVEAGFHPAPIPESASVFLAGVDLAYEVEVLSEEVEASLEFLSAQGYADQLVRS